MVLEYLILNIAGSKALRMPSLIPNITIDVAGIPVPLFKIMTIVIAIITMIALNIVIKRTKLGTAMRAVSQDRVAAGFMGIATSRIISISFVFGAVLATISGSLYSAVSIVFAYNVGESIIWWSFIAAVLGGIGSIRGAVLGGWLFNAFSAAGVTGLNTGSLLLAVVGAAVLLVAWHTFQRSVWHA
jgi:branched-chain amino acid transport system permease protein